MQGWRGLLRNGAFGAGLRGDSARAACGLTRWWLFFEVFGGFERFFPARFLRRRVFYIMVLRPRSGAPHAEAGRGALRCRAQESEKGL